MEISARELQDPGIWPEEVRFLPYVGDSYGIGIDGMKVLLLGESHYIADEDSINKAGGIRFYTRYIFDDCAHDGSRAWGAFFRRLDALVARKAGPSDEEAAEGWRHVAYANFVQESVGSAARVRPSADGWGSGRRAFPHLLSILSPDVILVMGRQAFNQTPDSPGRRVGRIEVPSSTVPRNVWEMGYEGGSALMTWVYHPSWPRDVAQGYVDVFDQLLRMAKERASRR